MKVRRFIPVEKMEQPAAQEDACGTETGENDSERQTNLSHQLEWQSSIIPYIPVKELIDNDPGRKLACGHKDHTPPYLLPERRLPVRPFSLLGTEYETESAQDEHGPVRKSAEEQFTRIVDGPSQSP